MPTFNVKVTAVGDGDSADLGTKQVVADDQAAAEAKALDELWDARLDCAGCVPEFETTELSKYLVSEGWSHDFGEGMRTVRFVFDTELQLVVYLEIETGAEWEPASKIDRADVTDSMLNANEHVLLDPEAEGLGQVDELPDWASAEPAEVSP